MPVGDGPHAADDGLHVELAAAEQGDDSLPDGPVVAEAALQRDVLLREQVDVWDEPFRLRSRHAGGKEVSKAQIIHNFMVIIINSVLFFIYDQVHHFYTWPAIHRP